MEDHSIDFTFAQPQRVIQVMSATWMLIFGTFEISEPGDFEVEVLDRGKRAKIYHPDALHIAKLADAHYTGSMKLWSKERQLNAMQAWMSMATGLTAKPG